MVLDELFDQWMQEEEQAEARAEGLPETGATRNSSDEAREDAESTTTTEGPGTASLYPETRSGEREGEEPRDNSTRGRYHALVVELRWELCDALLDLLLVLGRDAKQRCALREHTATLLRVEWACKQTVPDLTPDIATKSQRLLQMLHLR